MKKQTKPERRKQKPADAAPKEAPAPQEGYRGSVVGAFPIVGIGASAGGLEALQQFLMHVPAGSGMAFVIIQHLDPMRKDIMPELLQRDTIMKVVQVKDRTKVRPDCVYVIPPNRNMSILHGILHLLEPAEPRGVRLPIDFFFRSLAEDQQERSIGVILSGMGSDGTLGLKAIKEKAGVGLVQEPASAKFDGMPRSAIDTGLADFVAPVQELPGNLLAYLRRSPFIRSLEPVLEGKTQGYLEKAIILLRAKTGNDFSLYRRSTLYRRIERRMSIHQIDKIADYVRYLQENPQELELLFKELLIGVTSFFRDPAAWEQLRKKAIPALLSIPPASHALRAWVPGCSTGEEAYSLAIVFKEAIEKIKTKDGFSLQVFGTDLDRDAIGKARRGVFPDNIAADVSPERLSRFFIKEGSAYRVRNEIREMVIFAPQNLIMDPPLIKLDILSCRNLLIYLTPEIQKKLLPLFCYSLNPGGVLFLGSAESIGNFTELFAPLDAKSRLFRRSKSALLAEPVEFPSSFMPVPPDEPEAPPAPKPAVSLQSLADQLLLQRYSPPAVLVNDKGDILYISGHTGKYLEPAAGKADWNISAMAREGLRNELISAFHQALRRKGAVTLRSIKTVIDGEEQFVDVTVQVLEEPEALQGMVMIAFGDAARPIVAKAPRPSKPAPIHSGGLRELAQRLQEAYEDLRTTREEMQTSQEELKSTNEELQSTNEEIQSTNEELTTSKEEMQSLNEELQTVNAELQARVDELSRANGDIQNLLNSTDIATVFLDNHLHVRRFTTQATRIIKLIPSDVGRPISDLASILHYPELAEDIREVLRTLVFVEKVIAARDGRWFTVRIMPYRTLDNRIDGAVITLTDTTAAKTLGVGPRNTQAGWEERSAGPSAEPTSPDEGSQTEIAGRKRIEEHEGTLSGFDGTKGVKP